MTSATTDRFRRIRDRASVGVLSCVLLACVGSVLVDSFVLSPHRELQAAVKRAESRLHADRVLLADAEEIHARWLEIESLGGAANDSLTTESAVLARVAHVAGPQVLVKSVAPRRHADGRTMQLALDFEGPFPSVVHYVETLLRRSPSKVTRLSLAADPRSEGHVIGRMTIEVVGLEH